MKRLIVIAAVIFGSCKTQGTLPMQQAHKDTPCPTASVIHDTIRITRDSIVFVPFENKKRYDSLYSKWFVLASKMESIKKYVAIVGANRSQEKFLLGWMRAALQ